MALVSNNIAHGLIELGVAKIYSTNPKKILVKSKKTKAERRAERRAKSMKSPTDKMMRVEKVGGKDIQGYKIK